MREVRVRLIGQPSPDGEILVNDLVDLARSVKDLVYRLTREAADRGGLGRTIASIESLSEVRVGIQPGSTVLNFRLGDPNSLEGSDPFAEAVDRTFEEIVHAISENDRLEVSGPVADATFRFTQALKRSATSVEVSLGAVSVFLEAQAIEPALWDPSVEESAVEASLFGWLQMVDVRSGRFRIEDAAGNDIELYDVRNPAAAAQLVTQRVQATGQLTEGSTTRRPRLQDVIVVKTPNALERLGVTEPRFDLESAVTAAAAASHVEVDPIELTDDEFDAFVAAINGL